MKLPLLFLLMSPPRYVPERGEREREREEWKDREEWSETLSVKT